MQTAESRHALDTEIRNTLLSDMLGLGIGYWADDELVEETDDTHLTLTIKVTDRETDTEYTVHLGGGVWCCRRRVGTQPHLDRRPLHRAVRPPLDGHEL